MYYFNIRVVYVEIISYIRGNTNNTDMNEDSLKQLFTYIANYKWVNGISRRGTLEFDVKTTKDEWLGGNITKENYHKLNMVRTYGHGEPTREVYTTLGFAELVREKQLFQKFNGGTTYNISDEQKDFLLHLQHAVYNKDDYQYHYIERILQLNFYDTNDKKILTQMRNQYITGKKVEVVTIPSDWSIGGKLKQEFKKAGENAARRGAR